MRSRLDARRTRLEEEFRVFFSFFPGWGATRLFLETPRGRSRETRVRHNPAVDSRGLFTPQRDVIGPRAAGAVDTCACRRVSKQSSAVLPAALHRDSSWRQVASLSSLAVVSVIPSHTAPCDFTCVVFCDSFRRSCLSTSRASSPRPTSTLPASATYDASVRCRPL